MAFLLAERARSECARSTRAVKGSLGHSSKVKSGGKNRMVSHDSRSRKLLTSLLGWALSRRRWCEQMRWRTEQSQHA